MIATRYWIHNTLGVIRHTFRIRIRINADIPIQIPDHFCLRLDALAEVCALWVHSSHVSNTETIERPTCTAPRLEASLSALHPGVQSASAALELRVEWSKSGAEDVLQTDLSEAENQLQQRTQTTQLLHLLRQREDWRRNPGWGEFTSAPRLHCIFRWIRVIVRLALECDGGSDVKQTYCI